MGHTHVGKGRRGGSKKGGCVEGSWRESGGKMKGEWRDVGGRVEGS